MATEYEDVANLFVKCPNCGCKADYRNSELHDVWDVHCSNPKCPLWHGAGTSCVSVTWGDMKATYRELAARWNALASAWKMMHEENRNGERSIVRTCWA